MGIHKANAIKSFVGLTFIGLLASCGSTSATTPTATPTPSNPRIALSEMKVTMSSTFAAGQYTFTIANAGNIPHELLVFRSSLTPDKYPVDSAGAIVEDGAGITLVSDGDNISPGQSQTRTVDLSQTGSYLFVCNIPGHFAAHMYTVVTAT